MRGFLILLATMLLSFANAQPKRGRLPEGFEFAMRAPAVGETAPDAEVADADGERLRIFEARGKFLVLEFYLPSNEISDAKVATMNALRAKYSAREDIQFWTVVGQGEPGPNGQIARPEDAKRSYGFDKDEWGAKLNALTPQFEGTLLVTDGEIGVTRLNYGNFINQVFLIDPKGKVLARWSWSDPAALESAIDRALGTIGEARVAAYSGKVRPELATATRAAKGRRAIRALPIAKELIASGPKKYIADHDTNKSGGLEATEIKIEAEGFKRADRDEDGSLDEDELTAVRDAAEERLERMKNAK